MQLHDSECANVQYEMGKSGRVTNKCYNAD
jgi:hypothetical protein